MAKGKPATPPAAPVPVILSPEQLIALADFVYKVAQHKVQESAPFTGIALKAKAEADANEAHRAMIRAFSGKETP